MVNNKNIFKFLRLLVILPAMLLLFACTSESDPSTAVDPSVDTHGTEEFMELKQRECWQAEIVGRIYDTTGKLAMGMYGHMTKGAMAFMMVAFALWLSFKMISHLSSFTEESPAEVWTEIMKKFFICFACGLLATSSTGVLFVLNSIIFPIYNAFLELGGEIIQRAVTDENGNPTELSWARKDLGIAHLWSGPKGTIVAAKYDSVCMVKEMDAATLESFPKAPQQMMECMICSVNERLNFGYKLGWKIILAPGFMALIVGLLLMILFTFVKLGFVFYLVDSVFRFAMMVLILPLLIMAFAFKPTRKWTTTGFLTILNSGAFMMCIAIVMFMCLAAVQQIMVDNQEIFDGEAADFADFSVPFLMLLLVGFLVVSSIGIAKSLADNLVGGQGNANFQKRVGAAAAKVAKAAVIWVTGGIASAALANSEKLRQMKKGADKLKKLAGQGSDDEDENDEA